MAKAKKMTQKEFKEILEQAGISLEVYGWDGILNLISMVKNYQAEEYKAKGQTTLSDMTMEESDTIYRALLSRGYYEL